VPRPCAFRLLVCFGAGALIAAALDVFAVHAQTVSTDPNGMLRPAPDGERSTLQRFGQAERPTRPNAFTRPGDTSAPRSTRRRDDTQPGQAQTFGNPPASGAGATGFDSTNTRRRKARTPASARPTARTAPALIPLPTSLSPPAPGTSAPPRSTTTSSSSSASASSSSGAASKTTSPPSATAAPATQSAARRPQRRGAPQASPPPEITLSTPAPVVVPRRPPRLDDDAFAPLGVRAGSFLLRPAIDITGGYDTNPPRVPDSHGSPLMTVAPELIVRSDWSRHALDADLRGSYVRYFDEFSPALSRPSVDSKVNGRVDISTRSRADLEGRFLLSTDNPGSPNIQVGLAKLPIYTTTGGSAGVTHRFNRFEVTAKGSVDRTVYQDSTLLDGTTASNADRDYNQYGGTLRGSYEITPGVKPFAEFGGDTRVHDLQFDRSGLQRDSVMLNGKVGTTFEFTRILTGEISMGYLERSYKDPTLPELRGLLADASLVWVATPLTTATFTAKTSTGEIVVPGIAGAFKHDYGLQVDHAFRRWLIGTVKLGYGTDDYVGSERFDKRYAMSGVLTYKASRTLQVKGEVRQDWLRSTVDGVDYTATAVIGGLRFQL
jgi:hypothetical protein